MTRKTLNKTRAAQPTSIAAFLTQQQDQDQLRVATCGSLNVGKSTLVGRLLWEAGQLRDDQLTTLKNESQQYGRQGAEMDFALLLDSLSAEREQGMSIDVAYRLFSTHKRKFIIADCPGHDQYTRNMLSGASTADVAIILVDAVQGIPSQTRRHTYLVSLLGIRNVILAVNKMDLLSFDPNAYKAICLDFESFAQTLNFSSITPIPLSALKGDNIIARSNNTPWYSGPTLMASLETHQVKTTPTDRLIFPVQQVNPGNSAPPSVSGYVSEGQIKVGDEVRVTLSGQTATVSEIISMDGPLEEAVSGDSITLNLDKKIDASRGDIISLSKRPLETTDQFEATLVWLDEEAGLTGRSYDIKLATQWATASITNIKHRIDTNNLAHEASTQLTLNDISVCTLATSKPLAFDSYTNSRTLGSFILVDRTSNATVAAGMINHSLRRAQNVHKQALSITRTDREKLNGHKGKVVWFTGLSGSGKSTLANILETELHSRGYHTYILDGDNVRQGLNRDLGFTDADRVENIRRIAEVAKLMMDAGLIVMTAFISPFRRERQMARELIGEDNFVEVYVSTTLEVCEQRDVKGLYKKARAGQLPNLSGLGSAYEPPAAAAFEINALEHTMSNEILNIIQKIDL
jgi:bifunctional enzyme CysN/CysC